MSNFYLTTTLPYVNAKPHIGFALEIIQADVIARFQRLLGNEVFFNFGTDEHGLKIYRKAIEQGKDPQAYCDDYAAKFDLLKKALNLSYNSFIRTTDPHHKKAAQHFWQLCKNNGDIYKKIYPVKYCVGCELEKQESDLLDGHCPYHPNDKLEIIEEENYFFRWSKYQQRLLDLYQSNHNFVLPDSKLKEISNFVKSGLQDFSISRLKEKMPWGIQVPDDDDHVMYVWFDALINYISALGWPENTQKFTDFWGTNEKSNAIQLAGKDNLRQQSAMWQAMLMSAGLPTSKQILIHGFLTVDGQKMSKSLGNVIDPIEEVKKYGTDAIRYYLLAKVTPFGDSDYSREKLKNAYNGELANGLGNLVARVARLCQNSNLKFQNSQQNLDPNLEIHLQTYQFNDAIDFIWNELIKQADLYISDSQPWKLTGNKLKEVLETSVRDIIRIATNLQPFMPETSEKILTQFQGPHIKSQEALFPRI